MWLSNLAIAVALCSAIFSFVLVHLGLRRLEHNHPAVWERYGRPKLLDFRVRPSGSAYKFVSEVFRDLNDPALKLVVIAIYVNSVVGIASLFFWWKYK